MPTEFIFITRDGHKLTVKPEFINRCPNFDHHEIYALINDYNLNHYLHSLNGPAIIMNKGGEAYFMDGVNVSKEEALKRIHSNKFKDKFMEVIES